MIDWDVLRERINKERAFYREAIMNGATDWAEYRELVGVIKGLALAEREMQIMKQQQEEPTPAGVTETVMEV